jgi:hypothetical protein
LAITGHYTPDPTRQIAGMNEGTDTVQASISYTLPTGMENLSVRAILDRAALWFML